jgi:hypothetical protein
VNHLALIKTSDQPAFSSDNFSLFTSAEALRSLDIIPVPSLNPCAKPETKAKFLWCSSKENNEFTLQEIC